MPDNAYTSLRQFLDQFPLGFPATDSGVEIKILKKLFTKEEARIAVHLTPFPENARDISKRAGMAIEYLEKMLEQMSLKGLVFRSKRQDDILYSTIHGWHI